MPVLSSPLLRDDHREVAKVDTQLRTAAGNARG